MHKTANDTGNAPQAAQNQEGRLLDWRSEARVRQEPGLAPVIACIDRSAVDCKVVAHARTMADRFRRPLALAQVLEPAALGSGPQDPLSWMVFRQRCRDRFRSVAQEAALAERPVEILLEGHVSERLEDWVEQHGAGLVVFATRKENGRSSLGSTAHKLLENIDAPLLLVPPTAEAAPSYSRILVPLDGSMRAESVLPTVASLARREGVEVLLAHVVPEPQLTRVGPLEPDAVALRKQLVQRNEQVARTYAERVLRRVRAGGTNARLVILHGDPREKLLKIEASERADLIVLAPHGQSGRMDVPCGTITSFLAGHARVPILVVRDAPPRVTGPGVSRLIQ